MGLWLMVGVAPLELLWAGPPPPGLQQCRGHRRAGQVPPVRKGLLGGVPHMRVGRSAGAALPEELWAEIPSVWSSAMAGATANRTSACWEEVAPGTGLPM